MEYSGIRQGTKQACAMVDPDATLRAAERVVGFSVRKTVSPHRVAALGGSGKAMPWQVRKAARRAWLVEQRMNLVGFGARSF